MIDQVLNYFKETKDKIQEQFHHCFEFASDMAKLIGVSQSTQRIAKYWS